MSRHVAMLSFALVMTLVMVPSGKGQEKVSPEKRVAKVEKQVSSMTGVLKHILKEITQARHENDVRRLNCLIVKRNLVKGLIKASEKAKVVLLEAAYSEDQKTAATYATKVDSYHRSVKDIETSIPECTGAKGVEEGTTLVYIQPPGEGEVDALTGLSPWDSENEVSGVADYPAVPPASPFR